MFYTYVNILYVRSVIDDTKDNSLLHEASINTASWHTHQVALGKLWAQRTQYIVHASMASNLFQLFT